MINVEGWVSKVPVLGDVVDLKPTVWVNPNKAENKDAWEKIDFTEKDIYEAEERLRRFAPLLMKYFEDTKESKGIIESPLRKVVNMEDALKKKSNLLGELFLKMDSHLAVAGSIKARGGIYEVLYYAEKLALENGLITIEDDYSKLANEKNREFFSKHTIQVGSTGNLGLSIGITSATLGFNVVVHMSSEAKEWKKELLRAKGATIVEYDGDFTTAVEQGRRLSDKDPNSYFIDDENSTTLFMGYAVAALRLKKQMEKLDIKVDKDNPAFFYIPCGVGGAPGGITFGLKKIFGDNAHVFFVEPTHVPSMLIGMATGLNDKVSVKDFEIDGKTEADGLAVGTPSKFVGALMETLLSGIFTIEDKELFNYMRELDRTEGIRIEPSACATFEGPVKLFEYDATKEYLKKNNLIDKLESINHIAWATGGNLVPDDIMENYLETYLD
ncbi:D-serine ammonia-lyase [Tissierella sp. Yu-01]|uniref:D-serine ammonia-lyase n=1 Tax=Tissierella sp. Yu-01 TaxID=3035694 RepID=UPI00240E1A13|nr:D-serine ammonia-lyase [Tissierella sp. Yu-01]WFA08551.1 D-serine ammonia-lyase [Tissierella sp. Yu-01]